ncbi:hypothetical protein OEZ85_010031 [Tetradesmus obliquus]|uniref:Peptidoglycan binding-like domain-containing protein n=1 Tax=Tetradesmus obliquus TaxID=3088 RepID=A0ABY8UBM6_TETOB|nr:hypothetical protein OEZ85_010031 [Tetradesmus obliquus]
MHARQAKRNQSVEQPVLYGPGASPSDVRVTGVRDWRFNQRAEDIEWLLRLSAADGSASTVSWQILYNIASQQQWGELQRFLCPKLAQLRAFCQSQAIQKPGTESGLLFQPTPHAFKPWRRDFIVDWRHSRARDQLLFLVRRFDDAGLLLLCEEWCEVLPGNLPMWLMVKNYLLQYILLEATYLRSSCCITGVAAAGDQEAATCPPHPQLSTAQGPAAAAPAAAAPAASVHAAPAVASTAAVAAAGPAAAAAAAAVGGGGDDAIGVLADGGGLAAAARRFQAEHGLWGGPLQPEDSGRSSSGATSQSMH